MAMVSQSRLQASTTSQRLASSSPSPSPERSQPLHNFSMPFLKWGGHKVLRSRNSSAAAAESRPGERCPYTPDRHAFRRSSALSPSPPWKLLPAGALGEPAPETSPSDAGIEEIREKLLLHLRTAAKNMKLRVPGEGGEEAEAEEEGSAARPWNLRTRRSACSAPPEEIGEPQREVPPLPPESQLKSSRLRSLAAERNGEKKKERKKFSAVLSRDEIEEDFFVITGSKPSRRPKKRARNVQKQIEMALPGMWLSEVTLDMYRIS